MLLAFKVGEIDGLQMESGIVYVGSPFCPDGLQRLVALFFLEGQKWGAGSSLLTRLFVQMDFSVVLRFFLKSASF